MAERCIKSALVDNKTNFDIDNDVDSFDETCDDETYDELSSETSDNEESLKTGNSIGNKQSLLEMAGVACCVF